MAKKNKSSPPPQAQPIDYGAIMAQASEAAKAQYRDQLAAQIESYPKMEALQLGTISKISENLNNRYTKAADDALQGAAGETIKLTQSGDRIGSVADRNNQIAANAEAFASGPTALDRQISSLGASAMSQKADQVQGQRIDRTPNMQAASVRRVQDVRNQNIRASDAELGLLREAQGGGLLGQLESQAANDLALGRSLSAEQERDAIQAARAGAAARGMAAGNSAMAAELLNRDRYATQRENERRAFASGVLGQGTGIRQAANAAYLGRMEGNASRNLQAALQNQQKNLQLGLTDAQFQQAANAANFDAANNRAFTEAGYAQQAALANQDANQRQIEMNRAFLQNANQSGINSQLARGSYAGQMLGQTANLYGQQAGAYQNAAALGLNIANQSMANDPYMRAFAPGTSIGGSTLGTSANMIGNTYNNATQMAGNVASFNANMLDSRYNSFMNNRAALQGAAMQAGATAGASKNSMMGSGIAAGGMVLGMTALAI
jgi:hypothetical protein